MRFKPKDKVRVIGGKRVTLTVVGYDDSGKVRCVTAGLHKKEQAIPEDQLEPAPKTRDCGTWLRQI